MRTKAPSPHQWHLLRQLQLAGCPVDTAHLAAPDHPFRVVDLCSQMPSNIYRVEDGVGVALGVRLVAAAPRMISGYRLEASWLTAPCRWLPPCFEHPGKFCLKSTEGGHTKFSPVLNDRLLWRSRMKKGEFLHGFLIGIAAAPFAELNRELSATLWIQDVRGAEYPYELKLYNRQ